MDIQDIEYLIKTIDEAIEERDTKLKEIYDDQGFTGTNADWLKGHVIPEITGNLGGELLFIKDMLRKELDVQKSKKFYQFWK